MLYLSSVTLTGLLFGIAASAAAPGFIVASRDTTPFESASVINPWKALATRYRRQAGNLPDGSLYEEFRRSLYIRRPRAIR